MKINTIILAIICAISLSAGSMQGNNKFVEKSIAAAFSILAPGAIGYFANRYPVGGFWKTNFLGVLVLSCCESLFLSILKPENKSDLNELATLSYIAGLYIGTKIKEEQASKDAKNNQETTPADVHSKN